MTWKNALKADSVSWLLAPDPGNPGVRYFALRELLDMSAQAPEVRGAQAAIMTMGPVPVILDAQDSDGFWVNFSVRFKIAYLVQCMNSRVSPP